MKTGTGTLNLNVASNYGGGTTISAGTLSIGNTVAFGSTSGSLTVNTGGILNLNNNSNCVGILTGTGGTIQGGAAGTRTVAGAATIAGTLAPGASPGTLTFNDTLELAGATVMEIDGTAGAGVTNGHDFVNLTGIDTAGVITHGGTLTLDLGTTFGTGSYSWNLLDFVSETGIFTTVTLADQYSGSLPCGLGMLALRRRRRA